MRDPKEAALTTGGDDIVTVDTTSKIVIPHSPNRISLIIQPDASTAIFLRYGQKQGSAEGLLLPAGADPRYLTVFEHGQLVHGPWYGIVAAGSASLYFAEGLDVP